MDCRMAARSARYTRPPMAILCGGVTTMHPAAARLLLLAALVASALVAGAADAPVVVINDFASEASLKLVDYDQEHVALAIGPRAVTERQPVLRYQAKAG